MCITAHLAACLALLSSAVAAASSSWCCCLSCLSCLSSSTAWSADCREAARAAATALSSSFITGFWRESSDSSRSTSTRNLQQLHMQHDASAAYRTVAQLHCHLHDAVQFGSLSQVLSPAANKAAAAPLGVEDAVKVPVLESLHPASYLKSNFG